MKRNEHYVDAWKKVSGIRLWKNFYAKEFNPKYKKLNDALDRCLCAMSFDTSDCLTISNDKHEGFACMLIGGYVDDDGGRSFTYQKLHFDVNLNALVNNFDTELHRVANEEMSDKLSRLAYRWDSQKVRYGQSPERRKLIGIAV